MCGIVGQIYFNDSKDVNEDSIHLMMNKIKHRGPDDDGIFVYKNIGLGFVRLSILDLSSAGHQPMFSHDKRFLIIFNGEVYNYIEIRNELKNKYIFKTGTDTEVVLAAYQEWGEKCLDKFNGMFAFVVYDKVKKELFGARDRYGIKPLYYWLDSERFIFASEIKSILPFVDRIPNNQIIYDYLLTNRTDHTINTFFNGIKKLQHGHYFKLKGKKFLFNEWYNIRNKIKKNVVLSIEEYNHLLNKSLKLRLRADVPIGVSLSGGIDSSSITAALIDRFGLNDINTFSAIYGKNEPSDESRYIDEFKPYLMNMHYTFPTAKTFYNDYLEFIKIQNEPVPDIGPYAQYKVMELAAKYVKITLDGQGADEQLAGYHYFFGSYYKELLQSFRFYRFIYENYKYLKLHKSFNAIKYWLYYYFPVYLQQKISSNIFLSISKDFLNTVKGNKKSSQINKMLLKPKDLNDSLIQHFEYKLEHLLHWEDLNSMNFSIESRVPFLDHNLVEATLSTPSSQKIYNGETKIILRNALNTILPSKIYMRKDKKGFTSPRDKWFRENNFISLIMDLINSNSFKSRGYFNNNIASKQFKLHLDGKINASKEIWKWINLELWFREYID